MRLYKDGDKWCATEDDFVDLQISNAGFGDTEVMAVRDLQDQISMGCECCHLHDTGQDNHAGCEPCKRIAMVEEDWEEIIHAAE